jgi:hypothetical protein
MDDIMENMTRSEYVLLAMQQSLQQATLSNDKVSSSDTSMKENKDNSGVLCEKDDERPPPEERPLGTNFACPYHQHNPKKYRVNIQSSDYRSCAGPGWNSMARIK